uniref:Mediator of RNA polymerase II transcription subunit 9 n=1 Tax=Hucho hucho TaxID=62062 RepID=A0A4W5QFV3_9TELE
MEVEATNEDCSWLPFILDIIKCMDKDSTDVNQELTKLKTKIQETREKILAMPEIESSPGEQQEQLKTMREKVDTKTQLLQKYKGLCVFDSPKS